MWKILIVVSVIFLLFLSKNFLLSRTVIPEFNPESVVTIPTITPTIPPVRLPEVYEIPMGIHVFQTFNNCGPATLSMALSYVGKDISQQELGNILRPYQVPGGDNDDKSVTLQEVATQAEVYGLHTYLRPNGTIEKIQRLVAADIPVVTRTWLKTNEDIGHYRVVRGYDNVRKVLIQDDSLQGKNLFITYDDFTTMWLPFNFEYLVIVPEEKKLDVERILGDELDEQIAWQHALTTMKALQINDPENWHITFAISRIFYYLKEYAKSVEAFTLVQQKISFRTLWYQIEPILALYELGEYERVLRITDSILNNQNRAFSELYYIRGNIYLAQGNVSLAKDSFEKAVYYNGSNSDFRDALMNIR